MDEKKKPGILGWLAPKPEEKKPAKKLPPRLQVKVLSKKAGPLKKGKKEELP